MIQTLIGKKIEQTQRFLSDGRRIPVTVIAVPTTHVTQIKNVDKDGYTAVQIGIGTKKKPTKSLLGHAAKANLKTTPTTLKEVHLQDENTIPDIGATISPVDVLKVGDILKVSGTGKGKGFQGGVKRHGFHGGPKTHGQSDRHRAPGSIGSGTTPGRVYRGKKMAGHMGTGRVTVSNLVVMGVEENQVLIKGLVPGVLNSVVYLQKIGESKNPLELYQEKKNEEVVEASEPAADMPEEVIAVEEVKAEATIEAVVETPNEFQASSENVDTAKEEKKETKGVGEEQKAEK
jgi:large subunit ribosomal protein L3